MSSSFYAKTGIALQITERLQKTPLTLATVDIPQELGPQEVLIKVLYAAQNPVDSKLLDWDRLTTFPTTTGGDVSGIVLAVGSEVTALAKGDRVAAFLNRKTPRNAGYQQYTIGQAPQIFKVPSYLNLDAASTIPLAFATAVGGIFGDLQVPIPPAGSKLPLPLNDLPPILVWGGSSSVGAYYIQLAKLSGYRVVSTASPHNFDYVKSLGADVVIDYHDGDKAVEEIIKATNGQLSLVADAVSENGTPELEARSIGSQGGIITTVLPVNSSVLHGRTDIKILSAGARIVYEREDILDAYRFIVEALDQKVFIPNPVELIAGGLLGVNEGFDRQRKHTISGTKLVYDVLATPGIHDHDE